MPTSIVRRFAVVAAVALTVVSIAPVAADKPVGGGSSTGVGRVFAPNPVATLQDQTLTDQKDADYAALQPAYRLKTLTNLDGSGFLVGDWAVVHSETGKPAFSADNTFVYDRHDDRFEQVMAYYWVTQAQLHLERLGFGVTRRPVNRVQQKVRLNQWGVDNSFATDTKDELRFGKGGVDDAEDAEVILHEYGHAIHFAQSPTFYASPESGAIGEGFGDYFAMTVSAAVSPTPDLPCIADWDSTSYTASTPHCLRRIDSNKHYPENLRGEVHADGMIWSRALWDIRLGLGDPDKADIIIIEAQFDWTGTTMADLAQRTVNVAQALYGSADAAIVRAAFQARGILP
ncbi:MAG: M36 family metallopeptidase [Thermoflexales bacterium]|nr:M36 family metallopeptidase [Thermoflexales bacterium]